jgi:serine/threonine-protein kinase HipA
MPQINNCPSTLAEGYTTYSPTALRRLFSGRKLSHILDYHPPQLSEEDALRFMENRKRISISGVQEKLSLLLEKNHLRLTREGEYGRYILKPIPRDVLLPDQVPANEQLTMQIARQVYKLSVAESGLIFFKNGEPAYLTRRFDVKEDGSKQGQEDFASLLGQTRETGGPDFKYEGSYEEMAGVLKKFVPAYRVEVEKLFSLILFNYLFSNGDAHLKNYSLLETAQGDYILSPAYDLICTRLHVQDSYLALKEGLFAGGYETESYKANGYYAFDDFYEFAVRIGILPKRARRILDLFRTDHSLTHELIGRSFLREGVKEKYTQLYQERLKALNYRFARR